MKIFVYIICFLLFLRYCFVLYKYIKTKEFRKRVYKGNVVEVIAYSFVMVLIISFLILFSLVLEDKTNDIVTLILILSGIGALYMCPWAWLRRMGDKSREKQEEVVKAINKEFDDKYGNIEYDKFKCKCFLIDDNIPIGEQFNTFISIITNDQISFIHPDQYKDIADVFASLYQQDYVKLLAGTESIELTCEIINDILNKNKIDFKINTEDITKDDDEFIKNRRKDYAPTLANDISKISEIIDRELDDYKLLVLSLVSVDGTKHYPIYICIVRASKYEEFNKSINKRGEK